MYKITVPTIVTNGHFNKEKTLSELKRAGAHRIALAIDREMEHKFSSPENLELIKELIEYFEANGLETLVWLGETFGHDGSPTTEPSPYTRMRHFDKYDMKSFCPLDPVFQKDFANWVKNIAKSGAKMIMVDDDYRMNCRSQHAIGCWCERHMKLMCDEVGETLTADEFYKKAFTGGKNRYRDAWLKVQGGSMLEFSKMLRRELDTVSPTTRLGMCACSRWDVSGADILENTLALAGGTKPFFRAMGAPYWGNRLGVIIEHVRAELDWFKESGVEVFTEGDTYPRPRFACSAARLECFDQILRSGAPSDGILKYMLDYVSDADYETGYIDAMAGNAEVYKAIEELFADKEAVGLRPLNEQYRFREKDFYDGDWTYVGTWCNHFCDPNSKFPAHLSLPTAYSGNGVNILTEESGRFVSLDALKNGSIVDFNSAKMLMDRGIDVGIEDYEVFIPQGSKGLADVPEEYFIESDEYVRLDPGVAVKTIKHKENARIITRFHFGDEAIDGVFLYENADGQRFMVLPFNVADAIPVNAKMGWMTSYARRRQVLQYLGWLGKPLSVYTEGSHPYLYELLKENGEALAFGVWNLFEDKVKGLKIKLNCQFECVRFVNCEGHIEGDCAVLDTTLYPYEFAGIEIKK